MTVVVASAPRVIGTKEVQRVLGLNRRQSVYDRLRRGDPLLSVGYLGKVGRRHVWNAHILLSGMFPSTVELDAFLDGGVPQVAVVCEARGCDFPANYAAGLCYRHFARLLTKIRQAERSSPARVQLLAMCRWVVEHNVDVLVGPFDPWSDHCVWDGCDEPLSANAVGPFCSHHMGSLRHPYPTCLV